jgi:hypothetical protein
MRLLILICVVPVTTPLLYIQYNTIRHSDSLNSESERSEKVIINTGYGISGFHKLIQEKTNFTRSRYFCAKSSVPILFFY